jgi:NADPH-dependent curcumin reductase CurA
VALHQEEIMGNEVNRQWLVVTRPEGMLGEDNFRWTEEPVPTPREGQTLVRNLWLSFDPLNVAGCLWIHTCR